MKTLKRAGIFSTIMAAAIIALGAVVGAGQAAAQATCGEVVWPLTAGQYNNVGTVTVSNDAANLYVNYKLTYPDAVFGTLHTWAGDDLANIPKNNKGIPVPGQFTFNTGDAAAGSTDYTVVIPFGKINIAGQIDVISTCSPLNLFVLTHAEVRMADTNGDGVRDDQDDAETAFGGSIPVNVDEPGRWWFYDQYAMCCDFGGGGLCSTETAFAKGTHVWTTLKQSNPENLPSLKLTNNRWGWAINLTRTGTSTYDIWAGAGLNKTANGTLVGTLTVNWNGETADVKYSLNPGNALEEVHIYAADAKPTTVAPGQYGYPSEGYDAGGVQNFEYTVPLKDADGKGGVWLIAHAVVSGGQCE